MKKALLSIPLVVGLLALLPQTSFAAGTAFCDPNGTFGALCSFTGDKFGTIIGAGINLAFIIAVVVALVFLIYGGIRWIMSGGDKGALDSARNHIVAAIIGLIIVFLSYFIIQVILSFFGISFTTITIPTIK